jgi:hypothetical protein
MIRGKALEVAKREVRIIYIMSNTPFVKPPDTRSITPVEEHPPKSSAM